MHLLLAMRKQRFRSEKHGDQKNLGCYVQGIGKYRPNFNDVDSQKIVDTY